MKTHPFMAGFYAAAGALAFAVALRVTMRFVWPQDDEQRVAA